MTFGVQVLADLGIFFGGLGILLAGIAVMKWANTQQR